MTPESRRQLIKIRRQAQKDSGVKMSSMTVATAVRKEKVAQQLKVFREQAKMLRRARNTHEEPLPTRAAPSVGADWDAAMEDIYHNAMDEL